MTLFKRLHIFIAVFFVASPFIGLAQYKFEIRPFFSYVKDSRRWEIGANYTQLNATFDGVIPIYGYNNRFLGDSTLKRGIKSVQPGYGVTLGLNVPFAATGHISVWALSVNFMGNMYKWTDLNETYNIDGSYKTPPIILKASTMQLAMPIGIDWKVGCDAINTKRLMMGLAFGAGVTPHFNVTALDSIKGSYTSMQSAGLNPYVKAEVTAFLGMAVKFRAMYNMGNVEIMNVNQPIPAITDGPFRVTTNNQLILSFIIMPFSVKWRESAWFNDYDSYNWNEKLN